MQTNIKEYDESFDLTQALQKKGTKEYGFIHLAQRANGSWVNIPIMLAVGAQDGPTLVVDACNHGDEYEGTEGIIKTFEGLDVSKMKGSFIGIPALNAEAFAEMKRYNTLDFVPQDLNRIYPGGTGPMTAYVCSWYCENIIKKADAVICIHGGGNSEYLEPVVLYCGEESPVAYKSREMAQCFGFKVLWKNTRYAENSGIEDEYAYQMGISAPIQRETKMFLGADNEETAKLTVPMYDFGDWASRMKAYRKKNHITQQELAQLMGVKHFTLRSWEQKQTKPPYHVWRLHKHLFDNSIKLT